MLYHSKSLKACEIDINVEGLKDHIWIEIKSGNVKTLCGCVYRSPTKSDDTSTRSTSKVMELIHKAYQHNPNLIICGDFNYKEIDWSTDFAPFKYQHDFIETLRDCFLHQIVTEPTRYRENQEPSLLYLIISSEEGTDQNLEYHPPLGESDHLCLTFTAFERNSTNVFRPVPNIWKTNYEKVKLDLLRYDWYDTLDKSFRKDYDHFFNYLHSSLLKHTPLTTPPKQNKSIYMLLMKQYA